MKQLALVALSVGFTAQAIAAPSPEAAKAALARYGAALAQNHTTAQMRPYWSASFAQENDRLYTQQLAPLPAASRSDLEQRINRSAAQMVQAALQNAAVTCTAAACTVRATAAGGGTQTYVLVEEGGRLVIDSISTRFGP